MLMLNNPVSAVDLATLVQNKAYELTACEIEQRVFTRGGPVGDSRDEIDELSPFDRIKFLAGCCKWLYFEVRNTIKHRAQKQAYKKVAERMLSQGNGLLIISNDRALLNATLENFHYQGWKSGKVEDLWQMIEEMVVGIVKQ